MKVYQYKLSLKLCSIVCVILSILTALMKLTMHEYTEFYISIITALIWLYSAYLLTNPYLTIGDEKLVKYQGILPRKEYLLNSIIITKETKKYIEFSTSTKPKNIKIVFSMMDKKTSTQFRSDFKDALLDNQALKYSIENR